MTAIPSWAAGVGVPSASGSPVQPNDRYRNPEGNCSSASPVVSSLTASSLVRSRGESAKRNAANDEGTAHDPKTAAVAVKKGRRLNWGILEGCTVASLRKRIASDGALRSC